MEAKNKKQIYSLIIDFSFLPQVVWAALLCINIRRESPVLIYGEVRTAFLIVFAEIAVFAVLCIIKRFYLLRFLLIAAYIQLSVTAVLLNNSPSYLYPRVLVFTVFGIIITLVNIYALHELNKLKENQTNE